MDRMDRTEEKKTGNYNIGHFMTYEDLYVIIFIMIGRLDWVSYLDARLKMRGAF